MAIPRRPDRLVDGGGLAAGIGAGSRLFDQVGQVGGAAQRRQTIRGPPKAFSGVPYRLHGMR